MIPLGSSAFGTGISLRGCRSRRRTRRTMDSVISSIARSLENPAARGGPRRRSLRAIADTSTSSGASGASTLRAVGRRRPGGSRMSATSSAPSTERRTSMIPSEYGSVGADVLEVVAAELGDDDLARPRAPSHARARARAA